MRLLEFFLTRSVNSWSVIFWSVSCRSLSALPTQLTANELAHIIVKQPITSDSKALGLIVQVVVRCLPRLSSNDTCQYRGGCLLILRTHNILLRGSSKSAKSVRYKLVFSWWHYVKIASWTQSLCEYSSIASSVAPSASTLWDYQFLSPSFSVRNQRSYQYYICFSRIVKL